jgi:hypothetical protein
MRMQVFIPFLIVRKTKGNYTPSLDNKWIMDGQDLKENENQLIIITIVTCIQKLFK